MHNVLITFVSAPVLDSSFAIVLVIRRRVNALKVVPAFVLIRATVLLSAKGEEIVLNAVVPEFAVVNATLMHLVHKTNESEGRSKVRVFSAIESFAYNCLGLNIKSPALR
jgi:hypothetical protein